MEQALKENQELLTKHNALKEEYVKAVKQTVHTQGAQSGSQKSREELLKERGLDKLIKVRGQF